MENFKKLKELEDLIKSELGIASHEVIIGSYSYTKKGKKYYRVITYDPKTKKNKRYHVSVKKQEMILILMQEYKEALGSYKSALESLKETLKEGIIPFHF